MQEVKRIGVLTGGGDCPGLNAAIRAVVMRASDYGYEVYAIENGWAGAIEDQIRPLPIEEVEYIIGQGGTIIHTSRTNPYSERRLKEGAPQRVYENVKKHGIDAIVAIGGDDTQSVAARLSAGEGIPEPIPCVGVPKTMDNDVWGTDWCFGFDSAVTVAVDAAERLRDTARSHHRVMVLEVMGRKAGWVALFTALGAGADWVLVPEESPAPIEQMCEELKKEKERGKKFGLVIVSEGIEHPELDEWKRRLKDVVGGWEDEFGHVRLSVAVGEWVANVIERETGFETRAVTLGHVQRGGAPTMFDRLLASRLGVKAVDLIHEGRFGEMAAVKGAEITSVPLSEVIGKTKTVPKEWIEFARIFFK